VKIIAGLGNPDDKYKETRHNIGFVVTGELASKYSIQGKYEPKFNCIMGKGNIADNEILIVQPLTYMNLSGLSVSKVLNWFKIDYSNLFVVYDDISLDIGKIRFRPSGSDGGHNGVKSIIEYLNGFNGFARLKVGIGPDPGGIARKQYVLQKFTEKEKKILKNVIPACIEGIEVYLKEGIDTARNKYNGLNFSQTDDFI